MKGAPWPALVPADSVPGHRVRPLFTLRTAVRILEDLKGLTLESYRDDDIDETELFQWHREGADLVIDAPSGDAGRFPPDRRGLYRVLPREYWVELMPQIPHRAPSARWIAGAVSNPSQSTRSIIEWLRKRVQPAVLVQSYAMSAPTGRWILLGLVAEIDLSAALPLIYDALTDDSPSVRTEAVHLISGYRPPGWLEAVRATREREDDPGSRSFMDWVLDEA